MISTEFEWKLPLRSCNRGEKGDTFSEHLYSSEKATATIVCSENTTVTFVSSQIGDRWIGKWATKRHQNPLGRPHQCDQGSNPGVNSKRSYSLLFGSLLCFERFFSGYSGFPLSSKTSIYKFHFDQESGRRRITLWMCYLQIIIYLLLFIYLRRFPCIPKMFIMSSSISR